MVKSRPNIFFLCMHKAASTFVADVLFNSLARRTAHYNLFHVGSFLIRYVKRQQEDNDRKQAFNQLDNREQLLAFLNDQPIPPSNVLVGRLYPCHMEPVEEFLRHPLPDEDNRLLVMRRDPRDALVSLFYSLSKSHCLDEVEGDESKFLSNRKELANQDVRDGLKKLLQIDDADTTTPEFLHCTELILTNDNVCDLPYELLIRDPYLWLAKFVEFANLDDLVDDEWMDQMAGHLQPPEVEDPTSHKRRMKPGNWMDVFDDELKDLVTSRIGDRLETFGYSW